MPKVLDGDRQTKKEEGPAISNKTEEYQIGVVDIREIKEILCPEWRAIQRLRDKIAYPKAAD